MMKLTHSNRRLKIFVGFVLIYVCFLTGCANNVEGRGASGQGGGNNNLPGNKTEAPSSKTGNDGEENRELKIYAINIDTNEVEDSVAYIPADEEISVRVVADAVIDGFDNYGIEIQINDAVVENNNAVVDFKKYGEGPGIFKEPTRQVEETVLNCISYSILDNIPEVQGIIFRIDGQAYMTDNFSFEENQVYDKR